MKKNTLIAVIGIALLALLFFNKKKQSITNKSYPLGDIGKPVDDIEKAKVLLAQREEITSRQPIGGAFSMAVRFELEKIDMQLWSVGYKADYSSYPPKLIKIDNTIYAEM